MTTTYHFPVPNLEKTEPFFPMAGKKTLWAEMNRCAFQIGDNIREYRRREENSWADAAEGAANTTPERCRAGMEQAMLQTGYQLAMVTHDLRIVHGPNRGVAHEQEKRQSEHCGGTSTTAWRRGPGHRTLCNRCGLRYASASRAKRSMNISFVLN